jgi:serine/threonine-protein kinase
LGEAHGLGVIHRDIKPANVILTVRGGEPDVAKVVDFGLVKRIDSRRAELTMTVDGGPALAGTPLYLAPEAITSPDEAEPRSDVYSLGAVGYFLVTGRPLFESRTVMEILADHLHTTPVPPSVRLGRALDAGLEAVLMQCLAKTPAERPAGALALEEALAACAAATEWTADDARHWWADHPAAMGRHHAVSDLEATTITRDRAVR